MLLLQILAETPMVLAYIVVMCLLVCFLATVATGCVVRIIRTLQRFEEEEDSAKKG